MLKLPVVQLWPVQPSAHTVHNPSVCRHVPGLQWGEQTHEQFVPKYPSLQARGQNVYTKAIKKLFVESFKLKRHELYKQHKETKQRAVQIHIDLDLTIHGYLEFALNWNVLFRAVTVQITLERFRFLWTLSKRF